eukprot:jgi/Bigna1/76009/fgenesh1_pg.38_\
MHHNRHRVLLHKPLLGGGTSTGAISTTTRGLNRPFCSHALRRSVYKAFGGRDLSKVWDKTRLSPVYNRHSESEQTLVSPLLRPSSMSGAGLSSCRHQSVSCSSFIVDEEEGRGEYEGGDILSSSLGDSEEIGALDNHDSKNIAPTPGPDVVNINIITKERREDLKKRFVKKLGLEKAEEVMPKVLKLEEQLQAAGHEERERNRRIGISIANAGKKPWNTGRKHSAETLNKIRERTALAMNRPEIRRKLNASNSTASASSKKRSPRGSSSRPRRSRTTSAMTTATREAQKRARQLAKEKVEREKQDALERLKEGRGRVPIQSIVPKEWNELSSSSRSYMASSLAQDLFDGAISQQQLSDLETLTRHVADLHQRQKQIDFVKAQAQFLATDVTMGQGERVLLRDHIEELQTNSEVVQDAIAQLSGRLPLVEDLQSIVGKWIALAKAKHAAAAAAAKTSRGEELAAEEAEEGVESSQQQQEEEEEEQPQQQQQLVVLNGVVGSVKKKKTVAAAPSSQIEKIAVVSYNGGGSSSTTKQRVGGAMETFRAIKGQKPSSRVSIYTKTHNEQMIGEEHQDLAHLNS